MTNLKQVRSEGVPIDGPILLENANKFLQDLGKDTTVSRGWIDRWKKRHSIGSQIVVGESAAVNVGEVEKWKEEYYHNKKAWMVSDIFQTWVRDFDRRMTRKNRKVLLIIDNCPAHPNMNGLMSIRLLFTPPNTTSVLQPMDQGIIRTFKSYYRQQVLQFTVDYIDTHGKKPDASINVLQAIRWVDRAWSRVTKETIANCFHHGFGHTNLDQTDATSTADDNEESDTEKSKSSTTHHRFYIKYELLVVDADIAVAEHLSDAEIVQPVTYCGTLDESDREDEAEIVEPDPPTLADANNALDVLRRPAKRYFVGNFL
ncbi:tigger transposable element-derived protein 6-like [Watersipora subatra]|uniref:tigger transposable element-derived protein 6-like n=1 Tax=Watersipora subatra TaxID=2589382 RepID=UPI00355C67CE